MLCNLPILDAPKAKVLLEGVEEPRPGSGQLAVPRKGGDGGLWTSSPQNAAWKQRCVRVGKLGAGSS